MPRGPPRQALGISAADGADLSETVEDFVRRHGGGLLS